MKASKIMSAEHLEASLARIETHLEANGKLLTDIKDAVFGGNGDQGLKSKAQDNAARISAIEKECQRRHADNGFWGFLKPIAQDVVGKAIIALLLLLLLTMLLHTHVQDGVIKVMP
jgi:hypothetical protein